MLKSAASTREISIPAEYKTVTKQVLKNAASTREVEIAAEYKTVSKRVMTTPPTPKETVTPAEYKTVSTQSLVKKGGYADWREVLCDSKITVSKARQVQDALRAKGYDPGVTDNVIGAKTRAALIKYQQANKLPVGSLDAETLKSLGVDM